MMQTDTQRPPRPVPLPLQAEQLPPEIRALDRFVAWAYTWKDGNGNGDAGKWDKPPYVATETSTLASSTDPKTWRTFQEAVAAVEDGKVDGLGIGLGPHENVPDAVAAGNDLAAIDLDKCIDAQGTIAPWAAAIVAQMRTYTERSPGRTGLRLLFRATQLPAVGRKKGQFEIYNSGRYVTLTGHHLPGTPDTIETRTAEAAAVHAQIFGAPADKPAAAPRPAAAPDLDDAARLDRARHATNGALFSALMAGDTSQHGGDDSAADLALSNLLAFWLNADAGRIDAAFRQSGLMRPKWDERRGAETYGQKTIKKAISDCRETFQASIPRARVSIPADPAGGGPTSESDTSASVADDPTADEPLILDPNDPVPSARRFLDASFTEDGLLTLRHQAGQFFLYDRATSAYRERDEGTVRADLYGFLERAQRWTEVKTGQWTRTPFKPTKSKIENVRDALHAVANLPTTQAAPCWLQDHPGVDPFDVLASRGGLLHIPTREILAPTPAFFTRNGLDFAYNPLAPEPEQWLRFLDQLWSDDAESIATLQEWMGYLLTPRTHFQKIAMIVGPKRSGKGTIGRVTRRLLGELNVCGPTLANMGEQFGLSTLIGKTAAFISDARVGGRSDTSIITERLLSISGEDALSIPRKYLPDWTGKLAVRFVILTNELPRIEDASGALSSRFIVLTLHQSFFGREDHGLFDRFVPELPGILNWALAGWDRLYARGRFVQPNSSEDLIQGFEDLAAPIGAFVRERCDVARGHEVQTDQLFSAWKTWCDENGRKDAGTVQVFGRDLRAAHPWLGERQRRVVGHRLRHYVGIRLKPAEENE